MHKMFPHPADRRHPHFRQEGGGKYPHTTWERAVESAARMSELQGRRYEPYLCITCEKYHIGRGLLDSHLYFEQEEWRLELGDRVAAHLIVENHKTSEKRLAGLLERFYASERRRLYPNFWHGHRHGSEGRKKGASYDGGPKHSER